MTCDVAIVGAGPGGSTLAALLAGRGLSVALIDRDVFPRDKLCGEFLSYDALPILERLGVLVEIDQCDAPRIDRCRVVGRRHTYEFALPHAARGVSRLLLDDLLIRTAAKSGAERLDGWTAEQIDGGSVQIARGGQRRTIEARTVVGAWGRWGRFDTQLRRGFVRDRAHRNFGFKRHYFAAPGESNGAIDLYSFRDGYLGVNAVESGITNICGLVHARRLEGHRGRWDAFVRSIAEEEPQLAALYSRHMPAQEQFLSSEPVIFRARSAVEGGIFMIGDASGVIDPLTGNGMAMAIQSALLLAPYLVRLVASPPNRTTIENEYREAHRAMFLPRIAWSRRVARLLSRPALLEAALATVRWRGAGEFFLRHTRADRHRVARMSDEWFA